MGLADKITRRIRCPSIILQSFISFDREAHGKSSSTATSGIVTESIAT